MLPRQPAGLRGCPMRVVRRLLALLLALGAGLAPSVPVAAAATPAVPTLVGIRAAHHPTFDRVVFDFAGGLPASRQLTWVTQLVGDASGLPVPVAGRAVLRVRFAAASAPARPPPRAPPACGSSPPAPRASGPWASPAGSRGCSSPVAAAAAAPR